MLRAHRPLPRDAALWFRVGVVGLTLLLAGCGSFPQIGTGASGPSPAQLQAALQWENRYIYFPGYEIYYNRTQGYYVYQTNEGWLERFDLPPEVDRAQMIASPFAVMSFHDSPGPHHAQVVREYPRNWGVEEPRVATTSGRAGL